MTLTIDIGNTTTSFGVFEQRELKRCFCIATQPFRTADEITLQVKALAKSYALHLREAKHILICSVVPRMTGVLTQSLESLGLASRVQVIGQDVQVPLDNQYTYPEQVGQDRLVSSYAAWLLYEKEADCIVVDFGTAITMDLVTRAGAYLGGVIVPGLEVSLEALASKAALLPRVELKEPPELLGRDTANSIRSGVLYGCASLCDGLIRQLRARYMPQARVIATGGSGKLVMLHSQEIEQLKPNLVLYGLAALARA